MELNMALRCLFLASCAVCDARLCKSVCRLMFDGMFIGCGNGLFVVLFELPVCCDPVFGDCLLSSFEIYRFVVHARMECVLELVLLVEVGCGRCGFGLQVANRVRSAEFEWDQMVNLI